MQNVAQALKAEIIRVSRKEIKMSVDPIRTSNITLKKTVIDLKKKVSALETQNKNILSAQNTSFALPTQVTPDSQKKLRLSPKSIRTLRTKLGLSQESFAKLLGVSSQAVYGMEHKEGQLKLRAKTLANLVAVRGYSKTDAAKRLEELGK
jgi:DNA-binding transcriptional regulator YiaG